MPREGKQQTCILFRLFFLVKRSTSNRSGSLLIGLLLGSFLLNFQFNFPGIHFSWFFSGRTFFCENFNHQRVICSAVAKQRNSVLEYSLTKSDYLHSALLRYLHLVEPFCIAYIKILLEQPVVRHSAQYIFTFWIENGAHTLTRTHSFL